MTRREPRQRDRATLVRGYLSAVGAVLVAALLTAVVPVLRDRLTFFLFWPTVFAVSWFRGLGPGLLATALSAAAVVVLVSISNGGGGPSPADSPLILCAFCGADRKNTR